MSSGQVCQAAGPGAVSERGRASFIPLFGDLYQSTGLRRTQTSTKRSSLRASGSPAHLASHLRGRGGGVRGLATAAERGDEAGKEKNQVGAEPGAARLEHWREWWEGGMEKGDVTSSSSPRQGLIQDSEHRAE